MESAAESVAAPGAAGQTEATPIDEQRSRRRHLILFRCIAVTLGCLVPLLALELALRTFGPFLPGNYDTGPYVRRHPTLGHYHVPNFGGWIKAPRFTVRLDINAMGLRDPRTSYVKPPGTYRILALGDSYVEGAQVQADQMVTARMEWGLRGSSSQQIEVVNGGVFGYGSAQEYLYLDEEGYKYQPDLVVLFFCQCNDIANNNYRLELIDGDLSRALKPYYDIGKDGTFRLIPPPPPSTQVDLRQRLREASMLYNVFETGVVYKLELQNPREAFNGVDGLLDPTRGKFDVRPDGEWERAWRITDAVLGKMRDRAAEIGAPLVIVSIPAWRMLDDAYWQRDANKRRLENGVSTPDAPDLLLEQIADRLGVPFYSLRPVFQPRVDADGLFSYFIEEDYHWTVAGNQVAADAVDQFLQERGLLPR